MELSELQKVAHAIARDKGWWDQERTFGDLIALIHSELSEALEAYRERGLETWSTLRMDEGAGPITLSSISDLDTLKARLGEAALEKPEGVASELADVVIRVADLAEFYGANVDPATAVRDRPSLEANINLAAKLSFGHWISMLHWFTATAFEECAWFAPSERTFEWVESLGELIYGVQAMAAHYNIDLDVAIAAKMAYNRTRPYRHGGKKL